MTRPPSRLRRFTASSRLLLRASSVHADPTVPVPRSRPHHLRSGPPAARARRRLRPSGSASQLSPILLQTAPLLDDWVPAMTPVGLQLIGQASGHPLHGDRMVMTSPLWFADPDGGWVRTLSRFYRLGPPADPDEIRRILTRRRRFQRWRR